MTLKFVQPHFVRLFNFEINTRPSLGSDFVDRENVRKWSKYLGPLHTQTEINILLEPESDKNRKWNKWFDQLKNSSPPPLVIEWCPPLYSGSSGVEDKLSGSWNVLIEEGGGGGAEAGGAEQDVNYSMDSFKMLVLTLSALGSTLDNLNLRTLDVRIWSLYTSDSDG